MFGKQLKLEPINAIRKYLHKDSTAIKLTVFFPRYRVFFYFVLQQRIKSNNKEMKYRWSRGVVSP